jgi:DNA invertase Pin-like site-specific DNA recombinase
MERALIVERTKTKMSQIKKSINEEGYNPITLWDVTKIN